MPSPAIVARCAAARITARTSTRQLLRLPHRAAPARNYVTGTTAQSATVNVERQNRNIEAAEVLRQTGQRPADIDIGGGLHGDAAKSPQAGMCGCDISRCGS
jgi:hypothetical protein